MDIEINAGRVMVKATGADSTEEVFDLWAKVLGNLPDEDESAGPAFGFNGERSHRTENKRAFLGYGDIPGVKS